MKAKVFKICLVFGWVVLVVNATGENIALQSSGGVAFVYDSSNAYLYDEQFSQWLAFDGNSDTHCVQARQSSSVTYQRSWGQNVTLQDISITPYHGGGSGSDPHIITLSSYRPGTGWVVDKTWTDPGWSSPLTYTYSSPVTAQSIRIYLEAGSNSWNKVSLSDVTVNGSLSGSPIIPENIALASYGGTMSCTSGAERGGTSVNDVFDGDKNTYFQMAPWQDMWIARQWDSEMLVTDVLIHGHGKDSSTYTSLGDIEYWDGSQWIAVHSVSIDTPGDTDFEIGYHFDEPILTSGIRVSNIDSWANKYAYISEIYIYGAVPEPVTIGLLVLGFGFLPPRR